MIEWSGVFDRGFGYGGDRSNPESSRAETEYLPRTTSNLAPRSRIRGRNRSRRDEGARAREAHHSSTAHSALARVVNHGRRGASRGRAEEAPPGVRQQKQREGASRRVLVVGVHRCRQQGARARRFPGKNPNSAHPPSWNRPLTPPALLPRQAAPLPYPVRPSVRSSFTGRQMITNPGKEGLNGAKVRYDASDPLRSKFARFATPRSMRNEIPPCTSGSPALDAHLSRPLPSTAPGRVPG